MIPYEGYFSNFAGHLRESLASRVGQQEAQVTVVAPPYYACWERTKKRPSKRQLVWMMVCNLGVFFWRFVLHRKRHDAVVLASHPVAIPFLLLLKVCPFMNIRGKVVVMSFFLHGLGERKSVKKVLRFLLKGQRVRMVAQSDYEVDYYSKLMGADRVVQFPYCQHEVSISEDYGRGREYIFAGGHTNRDYQCLLEAARTVDHEFLVICSSLKHSSLLEQRPANVRVLMDTSHAEFHGYLKNSKLVVIPLKDRMGSSGQMVVLAAMQFGKAIVYTDFGSVSQYFEDGVSGLGYRMNDPVDLAGKIGRLLADPELLNRLGASAQKAYRDKYHIVKFSEFLVGLLEEG